MAQLQLKPETLEDCWWIPFDAVFWLLNNDKENADELLKAFDNALAKKNKKNLEKWKETIANATRDYQKFWGTTKEESLAILYEKKLAEVLMTQGFVRGKVVPKERREELLEETKKWLKEKESSFLDKEFSKGIKTLSISRYTHIAKAYLLFFPEFLIHRSEHAWHCDIQREIDGHMRIWKSKRKDGNF